MITDWVIGFFREFILLFAEMAPYLLLGFLFAGILKEFFPQNLIRRYVGKSNFRSALNASILGVPLPLCSCGVLPTGVGLYKNGASKGATVSFLVSTPQTGIDSILATYAMLGWPFAVIRPVVALVSGVFGGVLVNTIEKHEPELSKVIKGEKQKQKPSILSLLKYGFVEMVQDISKWLLIGLLLAALLSVLIPDTFFTETIENEYLSMLLILVASVPLYICATGSIPIAAILLMKGLSPGAALVMLMAGPATNAAAMAVITNSLGRKTFLLYLLAIVTGSMIFGIGINELLPREWIIGSLPGIEHSHHEMGIGIVKLIAMIALSILMINGLIQKVISNKKNRTSSKTLKTLEMKKYIVEGMSCNHCKAAVENGLEEIDKSGTFFADPATNELRIESDSLTEEVIKTKVESLGYVFKGQKE